MANEKRPQGNPGKEDPNHRNQGSPGGGQHKDGLRAPGKSEGEDQHMSPDDTEGDEKERGRNSGGGSQGGSNQRRGEPGGAI